jgi:hypothetical protein
MRTFGSCDGGSSAYAMKNFSVHRRIRMISARRTTEYRAARGNRTAVN